MLEFPRWKVVVILLTLLAGVLTALPNLFSAQQLAQLPDWVPKNQLALGLDLQGGSHILLEVETDAVVKARLESLEESARSTLRETNGPNGQRIAASQFQVQGQTLAFLVRDPANVDAAVEAIRAQRSPVGGNFSGTFDYDVRVVDGTRVLVELSEAGIRERKRLAVEQSIEIVRKRIDALGTKEPSISRQGEDRIVVQVPGLQDPERLKELLGKTAKLEFKMVDQATTPEQIARGRANPGSELLPVVADQQQILGPMIAVNRRALVTGEQLIDARGQQSQQAVGYEVSFRFDSVGARRFAEVTRANIGRPFAIVLDGNVISAPVIQSAILGGSGVITGNFSAEESSELAALLRAGALPAPLTVLEERTVGPDLGADSIAAGEIASIIGTVLVVLLMLVVYGRFGIYANIAVILNVILILGAMSVGQFTMTLPGIAGLVLTVGTAVDANVLIYERIREELRNGRTTMNAVDAGYREASRAIFDANITNLIAAILMFWFGSGPIRGFAVVLTIGIITSVFTAITVCRLMTVQYLRSARPQKLVL
jgi:preprotein translocase subunit SecD